MDDVVAQVAAGIWQVRLPLPFPLKIVNCYLLADDGGWTLVDTGLNDPAGRAAWDAAFQALGGRPSDIRRIILTHTHPDHYGMAGWLAAQSGAPVFCSPPERAFAERAWLPGAANERAITAMFREHGMPAPLADVVADDIVALRAMTQPPPELLPLDDGAALRIGPRQFRTIMTPGHSDGHLVLYCDAERLLLCGDTVLVKITPNISIWPGGRPNPLADFLATLERLAALPVALALPGHRAAITAFAARLAELRAHHDERLHLAEAAAGAGESAYTICRRIFPVEDLSSHQIRFAMAETLAHLEYLAGAGRVERLVGAGGVRYRRAG